MAHDSTAEMSQSDLNEVKSVIRAILVSNAGKYYTIKDICMDYEECEGGKLPFSRFNCRNPLEFLLMMPDTVQVMFDKELEPEKYGFENMDSFMKYLEDTREDIVFRRIQERTVMRLRNPDEMNASRSSSSPRDESSLSANSSLTQENNQSQCSPRARSPLPGEVTYDPYPSEVCNPDFRLEADLIKTRLKAEETFAASFTEINSPNDFYLVHVNRMRLVKDMMVDLDHFYKKHEAKYEIEIGLVTRDLLCACVYTNTGIWHRVQVLSTYLKTAEILYVDYGTKESVDVQQLRYLHKDFAELPALTIRCKLSGIQPKDGACKYEHTATRAFSRMCREHVENYGVSVYNVKIVHVHAIVSVRV